jgi:hypothetical protein
VLPWVAGFAAAQDRCPALMAIDDAALVEPLALLYLHFDREDLEDADALLEVIDTLEPPADLAEAVQDLVRALMLIADVTRPAAEGGHGRAAPPRCVRAARAGAAAAEAASGATAEHRARMHAQALGHAGEAVAAHRARRREGVADALRPATAARWSRR